MKQTNKKTTKKKATAKKEQVLVYEREPPKHKISRVVIERKLLGSNILIEMVDTPADKVKETLRYLTGF